jgi:hypothetical protein
MDLTAISGIVAIVAVVVLLVPLLLGGIFVIVVVANRAVPDPSGRRPTTVYAFSTAFLTLFVTLFASFAIVTELCHLIGTTTSDAGGVHPVGDAVIRGCVLAGLVVVIVGSALAFHLRAGLRLAARDSADGPVGRVRSSYAAAVCFVAILLAVISFIVAIFQIFIIISPAIFAQSDNRIAPLRAFIPALYLGFASLFILLTHLRFAPRSIRSALGRTAGPTGGGTATAATTEPAVVAVAAPTAPAAPVVPPPAKATKATKAPRKSAPRTTPPA